MYGFAIAALEKDKKLVGLRILRCDDMVWKDLSLSSVSTLMGSSTDSVYNLDGMTVADIKRLPVVSVDTGKLSKELYTVLFTLENNYIISNSYGQVLRLTSSEAKKLSYTNADKNLKGKFIDFNTKDNDADYSAEMLFGLASYTVKDGVFHAMNSNSDEIVMPDNVVELGSRCWDNLGGNKMSYVRFSPNLGGLHEYQLNNLYADKVVIPKLLGGCGEFAFSGCHIDKLYIQDGESLPHRLAFLKSDIKVIYVPSTVITYYRKILVGTRSKVKVLDTNV